MSNDLKRVKESLFANGFGVIEKDEQKLIFNEEEKFIKCLKSVTGVSKDGYIPAEFFFDCFGRLIIEKQASKISL